MLRHAHFYIKGGLRTFAACADSLRSTSRSGHSDLLAWLLRDFGMSYFYAPSRLKSATCHHRPFSDWFKRIEMGGHLSWNISIQIPEPSFKAPKYVNRSSPFLHCD
jgi:hypothetical protein